MTETLGEQAAKETLVRHLASNKSEEKHNNQDIDDNRIGDDFELVDEIMIDDLIYRKVSSHRASSTTEVDDAVLDNILDNVKGLENENILLRQKLKLEKEKFAAENQKKKIIEQQLKEQQRQLKVMKDHVCSKNRLSSNPEDVESFHGFTCNESKARSDKKILDKIVSEEETAIAALETLEKQKSRRHLLNMLICKIESTI